MDAVIGLLLVLHSSRPHERQMPFLLGTTVSSLTHTPPPWP